MAATTGLTGAVTSWVGTFNAATLALLKPAEFSLDSSAQELDTTAYLSPTIVKTKIKGLRQWAGSFGGYLATPANGIAGSVSGAAYTANVKSWELSLKAGAVDTTAWSITAGNWRTFTPGLVEWGGSFEAIVDDTTAIALAADSTEPLSVTFTASAGNTLAGSVFTTSANVTSRVGDLQVIRYTFVGSGQLTSVGSANIMPANTGTVATPVAGSLVLTAYTGRTLTGSAFWTEIGLRVSPDAVVAATVRFQGSGALTPA